MHANVGDTILMKSNTIGADRVRRGEIVEVHGENGQPPYRVRMEDGHESLVYPGPDWAIEPAGQR